MSRYFRYSPAFALRATPLLFLAFWLIVNMARGHEPVFSQAAPERAGTDILDLIYRQQYDQAVTKLEQILEKNPSDAEALTYLATAHLYQDRNFTKAQNDFKEAFKAGGGATFFVTHSHENFSTGDVVDYCRGWLHLRKDSVQFVPLEGSHGFK